MNNIKLKLITLSNFQIKSGWSFMAGILLVCSVVTIAFVSFMWYKMRKIAPILHFMVMDNFF